MFYEAVDLYRTGDLNLFKHVAKLINRGPADCTTSPTRQLSPMYKTEIKTAKTIL